MSEEEEIKQFESLGVAQVRDFAADLVGGKRARAYKWLELKAQEERALNESLQTIQASAASRAADAAIRAADAAEAQARTAKHALITAIVANIIAVIALILGIISLARPH